MLESVPAIENTPFWTVFDSTVAVVFTVEYVLRIYVAPDGRGDEEYDENGTRPMPASPLIARLRTILFFCAIYMRLRLLLIAAAVAPAASLSLHTAAFLLPRAAVASPSLRTVSLRPAATRTARARPPSATAEPLAAAAALSAADSASVLVGADMFGKTFLAGISIAAATLVTTIFVGL